jgi:hypothetical protein
VCEGMGRKLFERGGLFCLAGIFIGELFQ